MVFIIVGMGGGIGIGVVLIIVGVVKNMGVLIVVVVIKFFDFEGNRRREVVEEGIVVLRDKVDILIIVLN